MASLKLNVRKSQVNESLSRHTPVHPRSAKLEISDLVCEGSHHNRGTAQRILERKVPFSLIMTGKMLKRCLLGNVHSLISRKYECFRAADIRRSTTKTLNDLYFYYKSTK